MKDKFGREIDYLRISVTDNCNLRCVYCMEEKENTFLKEENKLTDDEIYRIVKSSAKLGIKKIRITGGEPLVRPGIVSLISKLNSIDGIDEIYMTTNGILLLDKLDDLVENGLKGINISLDSLNEETFRMLTRNGELSKVLEAIDKALDLGIKVKLNTVIIKDINENEILDFVELTKSKKIDVRFIELMPIGCGKNYKGMSNEEILELINNNYKELDKVMKIKSGGPANYITVKNAIGKIGFISAMSNCFCSDCNRIRLTAEGFLKKCLHFNYGVNLLEHLRNEITEEDLEKVIYENIYDKPEKHLFNEKSKNKELRFMNQIGG